MFWIIPAIASHFFWALVNIGDKFVVVEKVKSPSVFWTWQTMIGLVAILLIPFIDFAIPDTKTLLLLFIAGFLYYVASLPYFAALKFEEITRINIWWNLLPLFSLFIAWITLQEKLTPSQLIAFALLVGGAFVASYHADKKGLHFSKGLWYMMLACFLYSVDFVIIRYISETVPFINIFVWISIFTLASSSFMFLSKKFRRDFKTDLKVVDKKVFGMVLSISLLDRAGIFLNFWALSLAPVALVYSVEGFQVLFVFIIVIIMSIFLPHILKEELDKKNMALKLTAMFLMILGIIVLALF